MTNASSGVTISTLIFSSASSRCPTWRRLVAAYAYMISSVNPGVVKNVPSSVRCSEVYPISSSSSRTPETDGSSLGSSVPAGSSVRVFPTAKRSLRMMTTRRPSGVSSRGSTVTAPGCLTICR